MKRRFGWIPDIYQRVSRSTWIREAVMNWPWYKPTHVPMRLYDICTLVTAQENACRYCLGVARTTMKIYGYSEKTIRSIERDALFAETNERERAFIRFCRNLSRSNPRPPKSDCAKLIKLGFSQKEVTEMAFVVGAHCFVNRVATFISVPPLTEFEAMPDRLLVKLLRPFVARRVKRNMWKESPDLPGEVTTFPYLVNIFDGLPAAKALNDTFAGAMQSSVLSQTLKILMFAVVARSLSCAFCEGESEKMALQMGFTNAEFEKTMRTLHSPRLTDPEKKILEWTRETIHFENSYIQKRIAQLSEEVDELVLLEGIGMAALANTAVRLAILLN